MRSFPDWNKTFYVETDASVMGVAAVLSQLDAKVGKLRPICYYSSSLNPSQRNYSAGQLEAWALVSAARKWAVYLKGAREIIFLTDHCPLQWLRKQKDPRHTFARWILELEELPYRVQYRPGKENKVADYLSRTPNLVYDSNVNREKGFEDRLFSVDISLGEQVADRQRNNPVIRQAIQEMKESARVVTGRLKRVANHLRLQGETLLFDNRIVVPKDMQVTVLEKVHSQAHFGRAGTIQSLRRNYFWNKMARDAKIYCRQCVVCQRVKPSNSSGQPIESMKTLKDQPGSAVGMDFGTLPWADGEFRYFLLIVDLFTRMIELVPLHDQTVDSIIVAFQQGWIYRGHGVPELVVTDQGAQLDGEQFREFCKSLKIEKRHTTPYHPQCDGMAERNIGFVKQVLSCLMLDRNLPKGSWPALLTEAGFYCNGMENASSKVSPLMLTYGRQPRSPIDTWCKSLDATSRNSHGEFLRELRIKQAQLNEIARENIERSLGRARERINEKRVTSKIQKRGQVMLRNETRQDSLDPRYNGPFEVLDRKGPDVKLKIGGMIRENSGGRRPRVIKKWVHLDRCKEYYVPTMIPVQPNIYTNHHLNKEIPDNGNTDGELDKAMKQDGNMFQEEARTRRSTYSGGGEEIDPFEPTSQDESAPASNIMENRRYPSRIRKPKQYYGDFVPWSKISSGFREKSSSTASEIRQQKDGATS